MLAFEIYEFIDLYAVSNNTSISISTMEPEKAIFTMVKPQI